LSNRSGRLMVREECVQESKWRRYKLELQEGAEETDEKDERHEATKKMFERFATNRGMSDELPKKTQRREWSRLQEQKSSMRHGEVTAVI
jgi:hypothetical protein